MSTQIPYIYLIWGAPQHFFPQFGMCLNLPAILNDVINQRYCPLLVDRGVDINFVSIAAHPFCTGAVHGKPDIYGNLSILSITDILPTMLRDPIVVCPVAVPVGHTDPFITQSWPGDGSERRYLKCYLYVTTRHRSTGKLWNAGGGGVDPVSLLPRGVVGVRLFQRRNGGFFFANTFGLVFSPQETSVATLTVLCPVPPGGRSSRRMSSPSGSMAISLLEMAFRYDNVLLKWWVLSGVTYQR